MTESVDFAIYSKQKNVKHFNSLRLKLQQWHILMNGQYHLSKAVRLSFLELRFIAFQLFKDAMILLTKNRIFS
jgi:hypothetical protein